VFNKIFDSLEKVHFLGHLHISIPPPKKRQHKDWTTRSANNRKNDNANTTVFYWLRDVWTSRNKVHIFSTKASDLKKVCFSVTSMHAKSDSCKNAKFPSSDIIVAIAD